MSETAPIHEYIASKWKPELLGRNPQQRAKVNMVGNVIHDLAFNGLAMPCIKGEKEKVLQTIEDKLPTILKFMEGNKFLVGSEPCYVDFRLYESFNLMEMVQENIVMKNPVVA